MELLKKINIEYSQYKKYLYKKLTTYTMISIKNKVKENKIIKDNFVVKINELVEIENKTPQQKQTIRNYAYMYKNTKVNWLALELALMNKIALQLNNEIYLIYVAKMKKSFNDYEFSVYGENLVSNDLLNTIKVEYSQHKKFLYKKLTTYTMISIKNKVKENKIIKDNFKLKIDELVKIENPTLKEKQTIKNYAYMYKNTKVDWIALELALINKMALQLNNEIYILYVEKMKKSFDDFEFSLYDENLVSDDLLKKYISKILKWCKKNYNRMSQIKKVEKAYNQKYYQDHKEQKGIKSREEVNKINGAKRHQDSKTLVLKYALDLVAQNEKITIKTIKNILEQNNEKLGNTQISIYLKELKNEGLINE